MKNISLIFSALVMMGAAGCVGSPPAERMPVGDAFPPDRFLTADASGPSQAEAGRAAMAELAAIFETRVYSQTLGRATSWIGEGVSEQFDKQVEQTIQIQTDVQLEGARIGRTWQDPSTGKFRAVAILDRRQATSRWRRELATVQMMVAGQVQALDTVEGRLSRLAALNRITATAVREAVIESRLSVLGQPATPASRDLTDIIAERDRLAHAVALFVRLEGNPAPPFARRLTARLTADGYRITPYREDAAGLITGTIRVQALALGNPDVRFIRAMADVQVVDRDTGIRMAAFDEAVRKGHVDEAEAARRAVNGVADQVARQLVRVLGTLGVAAE